MRLQTSSGLLLGGSAEWKKISEGTVRSDVDTIEIATHPSEAQQDTTQLLQFLQYTIPDADLQRLARENEHIATLRIDFDLTPQLLADAAAVGISLEPILSGLRETHDQTPETHDQTGKAPSARRYLEGAILGGALAGIIHALRANSGTIASGGFIALTTFLSAAATSVVWAEARSIKLSGNPSTGVVSANIDVSNVSR